MTGNDKDDAEFLIQISGIIAVSATTVILRTFPCVEKFFRKPEFSVEREWDFFMTCAGIGTGIFTYSDPEGIRSFSLQLLMQSEDWDKRAPQAVADFQVFVKQNISNGMDLPFSIGSWIIWNVKKSGPTDEEFSAASFIGKIIVDGLQDWRN